MEEVLYYSLDECIDKERVIGRLELLKIAGKIYYDIDNDILEIEDIDLSEIELEDLLQLLDDNDVIEYDEKDDEDNEDDSFGDFYHDYDDY
jgi:hypothetical protein